MTVFPSDRNHHRATQSNVFEPRKINTPPTAFFVSLLPVFFTITINVLDAQINYRLHDDHTKFHSQPLLMNKPDMIHRIH